LVDRLQRLQVAKVIVFQRLPVSLGCEADEGIAHVLVGLDLHQVGRRPSVVGNALQLQPETHTVIGAIRPSFDTNSLTFRQPSYTSARIAIEASKSWLFLTWVKSVVGVPADDESAPIVGVEVVGGNTRPTGIQLPYPAHHEKVITIVVATSP
jgi:hypothetical protein